MKRSTLIAAVLSSALVSGNAVGQAAKPGESSEWSWQRLKNLCALDAKATDSELCVQHVVGIFEASPKAVSKECREYLFVESWESAAKFAVRNRVVFSLYTGGLLPNVTTSQFIQGAMSEVCVIDRGLLAAGFKNRTMVYEAATFLKTLN